MLNVMKIKLFIFAVLIALGTGSSAWAYSSDSSDNLSILQRDREYEQALRLQASPDKAITPAKVLRWISALAGHAMLTAPSQTEFQPIVNVRDSHVRIIAQIAYKF